MTNNLQGKTSSPVSRRGFLGMLGVGAAGIGLAACGSSGTPSTGGGATPTAGGSNGTLVGDAVLPKHIPMTTIQPDIPSVMGSPAGYTKMPASFVKATTEVPGRGSSFTAMTALWGPLPPSKASNEYFQSVDEIINANFTFNITDGNSYNEKLQAVLASQEIPDFTMANATAIPRFEEAVVASFADLTEFLAGDEIEKYPNLAAYQTDMWRCALVKGRIYGIPYPATAIKHALFYRTDLFAELGIDPTVTNGDEFLELAKELTAPTSNRWAMNDLQGSGLDVIFGLPANWIWRDGELVHRFELDEYRASLDFNAKLFAAGVVHPDSVAGNSAQGRQRFISGEVLLAGDGLGGWLSTLREGTPVNPNLNIHPIPDFNALGGDPVFWKGTPSDMFCFFKKTDDKERILEQLALANYFASQFGSEEAMLLDYGVEDVHHTRDADNIVSLTDQGSKEVVRTYTWLARPERVASEVQYPTYVQESCDWVNSIMPYAQEDAFYARTVVPPNQFAALDAPFTDLEADVARGRRSLADVDAAVDQWRKNGGDELREHYKGVLDNMH